MLTCSVEASARNRVEKASGDIYLKRPPDWLVAAPITGRKSYHGLVGGKKAEQEQS